METNERRRIAVLIDGDNAEFSNIEKVLEEVINHGRVTVKRIYADWTTPNMKGWKDQLNKFAITPIQKFAYTSGKNSTDTALIIDAMDLLHSKLVDGFCIVSSDSDYTAIAHRIREAGLFVMGIGRSQTPEAFVKACEVFTYTEVLSPKIAVVGKSKSTLVNTVNEKKLAKIDNSKNRHDWDFIEPLKASGIKSFDKDQFESVFNMIVNDNGLAQLSQLNVALKKMDPTFDSRNFGYRSFRDLCESLSPEYEIIKHSDGTTFSLKKKDDLATNQ